MPSYETILTDFFCEIVHKNPKDEANSAALSEKAEIRKHSDLDLVEDRHNDQCSEEKPATQSCGN